MKLALFAFVVFVTIAAVSCADGDAGEVEFLCALSKLVPHGVWADADAGDVCKWNSPCQKKLQGITCDNNNINIISVFFPHGGLSGVLPKSIANLKAITLIDLSFNRITGELPVLKDLALLESFNVDSTLINAGAIPDWVCNANIHKFYMSKTGRNGVLPACLATSKITHLSLAQNALSGKLFDNILPMEKLVYLDLSNNPFQSASIPDNFFLKLDLEHIILKNAGLIGNIPIGVSNMTKLAELDLSLNSLSGTIPEEFENATMTVLNLGSNSFSGSIKQVSHIKSCDVSFNCLSCDVSACGCSVKQCSDHYKQKASDAEIAWTVVLCVLSAVIFLAIVGAFAFVINRRRNATQGYSPI